MEIPNAPAPDAAPFDFSAMVPEDVAVLEITMPGELENERIPTGWKITFAGPAHPKTVAWNDAQATVGLRKSAAIEAQVRNGRKVKADDTTLEEQRQQNAQWILARVIDWTPMRAPWIQEQPIKPTDPVAAKFLLDPKTSGAFVQMVEFLTAEKSFTKRSATT